MEFHKIFTEKMHKEALTEMRVAQSLDYFIKHIGGEIKKDKKVHCIKIRKGDEFFFKFNCMECGGENITDCHEYSSCINLSISCTLCGYVSDMKDYKD